MIDWMVEVLSSYMISNSSYFKAVELIDKYFAAEDICQPASSMHLLGIACIYIISKLEEV